MQKRTGEELNLLLDWTPDRSARRWLRDGIGSLLVHAAIAGLLILLAHLPSGPPPPEEDVAAELQHATRLVAPPLKLTQPEPTRGKAADQVNLDELLAKSPAPVVPPRPFQPPSPPAPAPAPRAAPPAIPAPPKIEAATRGPQLPPPGVDVPAPPPRIQTEEPKLTMQNVGTPSGASNRHFDFGKMPIHPLTVEEAARNAARDSGAGMEVEDPEQYAPNRPDAFGRLPSPYRNLVTPQLLSDPHGINFRPYLIQVLLAVKKNWLAVIPESARMGRRGYVTLQFIIARDGTVPKLVIASPSGTEAFDRAAVAGVSASNPFPPLPSEFPGNEIRVQFGFTYNEPRR
jgi:TonB family protein